LTEKCDDHHISINHHHLTNMARKLKGHLNKKGLKGALARNAVLEKSQRKLSKVADAQENFIKLKADSIKQGKKKGKQQHQQQKGIVPFKPEEKVLLVGEGDFSYAVSIIQQNMIHPENLIATSFDSLEEVKAKYPNAEENLKILEEERVVVMYDVDATNLPTTLKLVSPTKKSKIIKSRLFKEGNLDYILFNFPHTGRGMKDMDRNIRDHQQLVQKYFKSCKEVFNIVNSAAKDDFAGYTTKEIKHIEGKVILSLFEGEPYNSWNIKILGRGENFRVERSGKLDWSLFPEYHHRRTNGVRDTTKPAAERDARIYVFQKFETKTDEVDKKNFVEEEPDSE
jgi:Domain of unknown function (DUF2431).